jgi:hypothetical protein
MFFDENITKTKAFQEQLDQHCEIFAVWSNRGREKPDRSPEKNQAWLASLWEWLQRQFKAEVDLHHRKPV